MKKADLVKIVSSEHDIPTCLAKDILNSVFDTIKDAVKSGDTYQHRGFGKFALRVHKERISHDLSTGTEKVLPRKKGVKFTPSRELNKSLN